MKLVAENHPALHAIAEEVTPEELADGTLAKIVKKMHSALRSYNADGYIGVAIAAPQVGISKRVFLVEDQSKDRDDALPTLVAINPRIMKFSKKKLLSGEGCLSVPDRYGIVSRHARVTIEALDENGEPFSRGAGGLLSQIFQHECDHLDGILFVDRADKVWQKEELEKVPIKEVANN
ncbi:MAG: peptide deformylase [Candidatus Paceibacterota bacterium]